MMRVLFLVVLAAACGPLVTATRPTPASSPPLEVTWTMRREAERLRIDYTVHNHTDQRVVLVDQLRDNSARTDLAIVQVAGQVGTVAFVLGYVAPEPGVKVYRERRPIARVLDANASARGTTYAPWPLRAHHNFSPPTLALPPGLDRAVLQIGYVADGDLDSEVLAGETVQVPTWAALHAQKWLASAPAALP